MSVLDGGGAPLVPLARVVPAGGGPVLAKLKWTKPAGSVRHRMARRAVGRAEASGRLRRGGTVGEYTAGTPSIANVNAAVPLGRVGVGCGWGLPHS
jgi:cysteine synthase A